MSNKAKKRALKRKKAAIKARNKALINAKSESARELLEFNVPTKEESMAMDYNRYKAAMRKLGMEPKSLSWFNRSYRDVRSDDSKRGRNSSKNELIDRTVFIDDDVLKKYDLKIFNQKSNKWEYSFGAVNQIRGMMIGVGKGKDIEGLNDIDMIISNATLEYRQLIDGATDSLKEAFYKAKKEGRKEFEFEFDGAPLIITATNLSNVFAQAFCGSEARNTI